MSRKGKKVSKNKKNIQKDNSIKIDHNLCEYQNLKKEEYVMLFTNYRLKTFTDWPFDEDNSCNPVAVMFLSLFSLFT